MCHIKFFTHLNYLDSLYQHSVSVVFVLFVAYVFYVGLTADYSCYFQVTTNAFSICYMISNMLQLPYKPDIHVQVICML